jgi:hypothetical protein
MNKNKSQHFNFSHEAIPIMWHKETDHFLKYLHKDGKVFLRFYWKHIKENLGVTKETSSEGLDFSIKEVFTKKGKAVTIVLLTLPTPQEPGEVYYMALVKLPDKRTITDIFLMHIPTTRVYGLEYDGLDESNQARTTITEITPRTRNLRLREGPEPNSNSFYEEIIKEIKLERL